MPPETSGNQSLPPLIRASIGTAVTLGLADGRLAAMPTTAYLLTYSEGKCTANCGFCPQARHSSGRADLLSRVAWPIYRTEEVMSRLGSLAKSGELKRVCIQALNYKSVVRDLLSLVSNMQSREIAIPISISCQPLSKRQMKQLSEAGVQRIGISLDASTRSIFEQVKGNKADGPYNWDKHRKALLEALEVFGKSRVSTHLIAGLGETEKELIETVQWCVDQSIYPALFSFTPIPGTRMENVPQTSIDSYRRIQIARYLIVAGTSRAETMIFDGKGRISRFDVSEEKLFEAIRSGAPFVTSGCPGCNRPYYNERPSGPLYNFPYPPARHHIEGILEQLHKNT